MFLKKQAKDVEKQAQAASAAELAETDAQDDVATSDITVQLADDPNLVLKRLLAAHEAWFDITRDYEYAGRCFEGYAEFRSHGEGYILSKKAKLWEVNAFEYLFFKVVDELDAAMVSDYVEYMTTEALKKVVPFKDHMSSSITLVLIASSMSKEATALIRKTSFRKNFKLGLQGWADLKLAAVDLSTHKVYTNAAGRDMKKTLAANAGFISGKGKN